MSFHSFRDGNINNKREHTILELLWRWHDRHPLPLLQRIVAVEMNPRIFPRLRFNLEHNLASFARCGCRPDVELYNVAIGAASRTVEIGTADGTGGSIYTDGTESIDAERETVLVCTLNDVFKEREFDLIKIDIEGAEHEVFASPSHLCLQRCRWVLMEIHGRYGRKGGEEILAAMDRLGFALLSEPAAVNDGSAVYCFGQRGEV
jgi:FkbM family methyltransferase